MMPESKTNIRITLTDVIATLGFNNGSLENLFPVPQNFEKLPKSVPKGAIRDDTSRDRKKYR